MRVIVTEDTDKLAKPTLGADGQDRAKRRQNRQAAALRANLSRRKTQSRVRISADEDSAPDPATAEDAAKPKT